MIVAEGNVKCLACGSRVSIDDDADVAEGQDVYIICEDCAADGELEPSEALLGVLADRKEAVLAFDQGLRVVAGTEPIAEVFGDLVQELRGLAPGDIIQCMRAVTPAGCGGTPLCRTCELRGALTATFDSGRPVAAVTATRRVMTAEGLRSLILTFTTERVGDSVLMTVTHSTLAPPVRRAKAPAD